VAAGTKSGSFSSADREGNTTLVPLRESSMVVENSRLGDENLLRLDGPRRFPIVTSLPRLPLMIPDEILDYYGWVFCQGGFLNLQMTFEQFLTVVAAVSPSGLCPEYDEDGSVQSSD
jgi:hypothetical protein